MFVQIFFRNSVQQQRKFLKARLHFPLRPRVAFSCCVWEEVVMVEGCPPFYLQVAIDPILVLSTLCCWSLLGSPGPQPVCGFQVVAEIQGQGEEDHMSPAAYPLFLIMPLHQEIHCRFGGGVNYNIGGLSPQIGCLIRLHIVSFMGTIKFLALFSNWWIAPFPPADTVPVADVEVQITA